MKMEVIHDRSAMRLWSRSCRLQGKTVALVPTMGFLHEGHLSLVREAHSLADVVVVSIYINPGQFAPSEDLSTYPSDLQGDLSKLVAVGTVDAVFCPLSLYDASSPERPTTTMTMPSGATAVGASCIEEGDGSCGHETWIRVERLEKGLCGKSRPIFFRGVATIVAKLFNIVEPDVAVFGKKDYQQWRVISQMVRDLDFPIKIIGSEIVRETDGLAMSSRNVRLSPIEREKALSIYKSLSEAKSAARNGRTACHELKCLVSEMITNAGGKVDYVEIAEQETLTPIEVISDAAVICVAAWFGKVRLIDNMEINL